MSRSKQEEMLFAFWCFDILAAYSHRIWPLVWCFTGLAAIAAFYAVYFAIKDN